MATSGTKDVAVTAYDTLRFEWWQTGQDVVGNYTDIGWSMKLISDANGAIHSTGSKRWTVNLDGTVYSGTNTVGIGANSVKTLASGTHRLHHAEDGTYWFSVNFAQEFNINFNGHVGTIGAYEWWYLNTIPRSSEIASIWGNQIGSIMTVNINSHSPDFTHQVWWRMAGDYWHDLGAGITDHITWDVPIEQCSNVPNSVSGTVEVSVRTFKDGIQIGPDVYGSATVYVPDSVVPGITAVTITEAVPAIKEKFNVYVQGQSQLAINTEATGIYGSSVSKIEVTLDGKTYAGAEVETDAIQGAGSVGIAITVTDSRGRKSSAAYSVNVLPYHSPAINLFQAFRSETGGAVTSSGKSLKCVVDFAISDLNGLNDKHYQIEYKKKTAGTFAKAFSGSQYTLKQEFLKENCLEVEYPYIVQITIADFFGSISYQETLGTALVPWCAHPSGKGLGLGGYPQKECLQVFMPAEFLGNLMAKMPTTEDPDRMVDVKQLLPWIPRTINGFVENNPSQPFTAIIFSDLMLLIQSIVVNVNFNSAWGNDYYATANLGNYAVAFEETPQILAVSNSSLHGYWASEIINRGALRIGELTVVRPNSYDVGNTVVTLTAFGRIRQNETTQAITVTNEEKGVIR